MKYNVENGVTPAASVVHGRGGGGAVFIRDVDVNFHVLLRRHVAHGQVLHVRSRAGVFTHAQSSRRALSGDRSAQKVVDLLVVDLVTGDFDIELTL